MRFIVVTALLFGCGDPCDSGERELPASGAIRRARFVDKDDWLEVASANGHLVRSTCNGDIRVLGTDFEHLGTIDVEYDLSDEQSIVALAVDEAGTIAAITYQLEYIGDIDEKVYTSLVVFEPSGRVRWSTVLANDDIDADYRFVTIGPEQVFVTTRYGKVVAYAKDSGARAWSQNGTSYDVSIAADPSGGVTVASRAQVVSLDATGSPRWSIAAQTLGLDELGHVAQAADGSIAITGGDGTSSVDSAQQLVMLEPTGALRWSVPLGRVYADRVSSLATDGTRVVVAGDYDGTLTFAPQAPVADGTDGFLASITKEGVAAVFTSHGVDTQRTHVTSLTADSALAYTTTFSTTSSATLELGEITVDGNGLAILEIAQ